MDRTPDVVRYFPDRGKFVLVAVGCLAIALSCALKIADRGPSVPTVLGLAFPLLGVINCLQSLDRSRCHIELGPDGFTERSPLRARRIRWSEVVEFELLRLPRNYVWVVYRLADDRDARIPRWARTAHPRRLSLSDTYGLDAGDLVELLNEWRVRFGPESMDLAVEPS